MKENINLVAVSYLAEILSESMADFDKTGFINDAVLGLDDLELKQRVEKIIDVLHRYFPADYVQAAPVLFRVATAWKKQSADDVWFSFIAWPVIDYSAKYGLEHPELALQVLKKLTPLFSAEFAVRPLINQHYELSYSQLLSWCDDDDEHVRRLASEGCRPRLPWGKRLVKFCDDPTDIFVILEKLKDDASLYVRRSVANNLNDIAKDHPDKVVALCRQWSVNASTERQWLIRHALRSLVKQGHPDVFPLLGYSVTPKLTQPILQIDKGSLSLGENMSISAQLTSTDEKSQKLVVDYKVHHVKANGTTTAKVFKWKNINLQAGESIQLLKAHAFKVISTRKYYSGEHRIELLINGKVYAQQTVVLTV